MLSLRITYTGERPMTKSDWYQSKGKRKDHGKRGRIYPEYFKPRVINKTKLYFNKLKHDIMLSAIDLDDVTWSEKKYALYIITAWD